MRIMCAIAIGAVALSAASGLSACGDDRDARGLAPSGEVAAPFDAAVVSETEAERDRENLEAEQRAEENRFRESQE